METTKEEPQATLNEPAGPANLQLDDGTMAATRRTIAVAIALILAVGGLLVWAPWTSDEGSSAEHLIASRDSATTAAESALVAFNTVDPARAQETVDEWIGLAGGALEGKLRKSRANAIKAMQRGGSATADVVQTAVSSMDDEAGLATIIGVVEIRSTPKQGKPTTTASRFRVLMQRLGKDWRITYLETVRTTS